MRGYRKLLVILVALSMAFVLALLGKLTAEFTTVASMAIAAFAAANAAVHHAKKPQ